MSSSTSYSGAAAAIPASEFGSTHVIPPKGRHLATIVWLHGIGDNCSSWSQLLEALPLPNIKWICPTAPARSLALLGGVPSTLWFEMKDLSEDGPVDVEGLDASVAHVANLLSTELADIKLGVAGFSMGAATTLYSAICCANGKYGNGNPCPVNLSAAICLSGWLPCPRALQDKGEEQDDAGRRAGSLPLLLCHGTGDNQVLYENGKKTADVLMSTGFENVSFKSYDGLGHLTIPEEMDDVCKWLTATLELDQSES